MDLRKVESVKVHGFDEEQLSEQKERDRTAAVGE